MTRVGYILILCVYLASNWISFNLGASLNSSRHTVFLEKLLDEEHKRAGVLMDALTIIKQRLDHLDHYSELETP